MKIAITADAYALTSSLTKEEVELAAKYNPEALCIKDKESKKTVFSVSYVDGRPSVAPFGVTFGGATRDDKGCLTITEMLPKGVTNAKEYVADKFGSVIDNLKELEKTVPGEVKKIKESRKTLIDSISVS